MMRIREEDCWLRAAALMILIVQGGLDVGLGGVRGVADSLTGDVEVGEDGVEVAGHGSDAGGCE